MASQRGLSEHQGREMAKEAAEAQAADEARRVAAGIQAGEILRGKLDDVLDEIDEVLEENATEFVRNYRQKGGE